MTYEETIDYIKDQRLGPLWHAWEQDGAFIIGKGATLGTPVWTEKGRGASYEEAIQDMKDHPNSTKQIVPPWVTK